MTNSRVRISLRWALQLPALVGLVCLASCSSGCGCYTEYRPRLRVEPSDIGSFEVQPQYVCENEDVTVSWAVRATKTVPLDTCPDSVRAMDLCSHYTTTRTIERPLAALVALRSEPMKYFGGSHRVPMQEAVGSRTISLDTESTDFMFIALVEELGITEEETRHVHVFNPGGQGEQRAEVFPWDCTSGSWAPQVYAPGEIASDSAPIYRVSNASGFPIRLVLTRDDPLNPPAEHIDVRLDQGECTEALNGPYWGEWRASSHFAADNPDCPPPPEASRPNALFGGGAGALIYPTEPGSPIIIVVYFGCPDSLKELCLVPPPP